MYIYISQYSSEKIVQKNNACISSMLQRLENMSFEVANNAATFLNKICTCTYT